MSLNTVFSVSLKRICKDNYSRIMAIGLIVVGVQALPASAQIIIPAPPELDAKAYILMDADSMRVIVERNADQQLPPASLTKMMTSYIVSEEIEAGRLQETDLVTISEDAWRRGGTVSGSSTMFLEPNTKVPVIELLRGVIIQSGNDASISLAQHVAGAESAFADIMNQQAQLLGMTNTHFENATGWPADGHVSTARDLAILAEALIHDHADHYGIYSEKYFKYNGINQANRNKLLFRDNEIDGIKTGHTAEAGYGLVASAERDNMRLIAVVLGTRSDDARAREAQKLLSYGFRYYKTHKLYNAGDTITTTRIWHGKANQLDLGLREDIIVTIPRGAHENLEAETAIDEVIKAPIDQGQVLGELVVTLKDETLATAELVAKADVEQSGFFARLWDSIRLFFQGLFN
jgi:D-alanyl-D-alanine carboxypeptidase (penicillin-binding protein 5/6)